MFRKQLRRLYELNGLVPDLSDRRAYFYEFENRLQDPMCLEFFCRCEKELQCLDDDAWAFLKDEVKPYLVSRGPDGRRWQQLFDVLSQARAYNHLKASVGCSNVQFIPRASESGRETPDLEGIHDSGRVLCEVKTINISDIEVRARRAQFAAEKINSQLNDAFFGKLDSAIAKAKSQLDAYDASGGAQHLVYINICFDDWVGYFKEDYRRQIDQHLWDRPPGVDVFFWCE